MKIAVLSGKGGAGKTTVAVNLGLAAGECSLLDCDIEEPNSHLFLKAEIFSEKTVSTQYPRIDLKLCTNCGKCAQFCNFKTFISSPKLTIVMPEFCHDCGGCSLVCPEKAISYNERKIGKIIKGKKEKINLVYGLLDIGELSGVKIINAVFSEENLNELTIIDGPPGSACTAFTAAENADYAVLVTEPSLFGISDMAMTAEMLKTIGKPFGIIINKADTENADLLAFCRANNYTILGKIPMEKEIAELNAAGKILYTENDKYKKLFGKILNNILMKSSEAVK